MELLKNYSEPAKDWSFKKQKGDVGKLLKKGLKHWQIQLAYKGQASDLTAKIFNEYYKN